MDSITMIQSCLSSVCINNQWHSRDTKTLLPFICHFISSSILSRFINVLGKCYKNEEKLNFMVLPTTLKATWRVLHYQDFLNGRLSGSKQVFNSVFSSVLNSFPESMNFHYIHVVCSLSIASLKEYNSFFTIFFSY